MKYKLYKILILSILLLVILILNFIKTVIIKNIQVKNCFYDPLLVLLNPVNQYFKINWIINKILILIDSLSIDILFLILGIYYLTINGKHQIIVLEIALFFFFRTFIYELFLFPNSENYIFFNPGFPSLMVPYEKANDLFYSGHTGTTYLVMIYLSKKQNILKQYSIMIFFFTISILLIYNIHYLFDIILAILYIIYCRKLLKTYKYLINTLTLNIYVRILSKIFKKKKKIILTKDLLEIK